MLFIYWNLTIIIIQVSLSPDIQSKLKCIQKAYIFTSHKYLAEEPNRILNLISEAPRSIWPAVPSDTQNM